jgi:hypothetical protein
VYPPLSPSTWCTECCGVMAIAREKSLWPKKIKSPTNSTRCSSDGRTNQNRRFLSSFPPISSQLGEEDVRSTRGFVFFHGGWVKGISWWRHGGRTSGGRSRDSLSGSYIAWRWVERGGGFSGHKLSWWSATSGSGGFLRPPEIDIVLNLGCWSLLLYCTLRLLYTCNNKRSVG